MGSKNNPGKFDCYTNAEPDEPMFVLLGRDPLGAALVEAWADVRERLGEDPAKVAEARACARKMREWAVSQGKSGLIDAAEDHFDRRRSIDAEAMDAHQHEVVLDRERIRAMMKKKLLDEAEKLAKERLRVE